MTTRDRIAAAIHRSWCADQHPPCRGFNGNQDHRAADAVLEALRPELEAWREQVAAALEAYADNYPTDVFPEVSPPVFSTSPDVIAAKAMRIAYPLAAQIVRETPLPGEPT